MRDKGNQLLCTLLLGNVAVNAMLSILMADMTSGMTGFLVSTTVIVVFGEIGPQAFCSRNALWIGSRSIPLVKLIMALLYPATWPIAKVLDMVLGAEIGTIHEGCQLINLLKIHVVRRSHRVQTHANSNNFCSVSGRKMGSSSSGTRVVTLQAL